MCLPFPVPSPPSKTIQASSPRASVADKQIAMATQKSAPAKQKRSIITRSLSRWNGNVLADDTGTIFAIQVAGVPDPVGQVFLPARTRIRIVVRNFPRRLEIATHPRGPPGHVSLPSDSTEFTGRLENLPHGHNLFAFVGRFANCGGWTRP